MMNLIPRVRSVLAATSAGWQQLTQSIPEELLVAPPAQHEWSAVDCLSHLLDTERQVFPVRVQAFLSGQDFADWDPEVQGTPASERTPSQLAAEFAALRAANLVVLERLTAEDLARSARHSALGVVTLAEMLAEWAAHDLNHTVQAERAIMQPFIVGCGPWRESFAAHELASEHQA